MGGGGKKKLETFFGKQWTDFLRRRGYFAAGIFFLAILIICFDRCFLITSFPKFSSFHSGFFAFFFLSSD